MQGKSLRRSNETRSQEMRARLIAAARTLFAEKGYAETGTPEIVRAADVTRGALYHHFDDKAGLFRAVVEAEAAAVAGSIEAGALNGEGGNPLDAGTRAFFAAMSVPGRARLLLIDGPAVLGPAEMDKIDAGAGLATLRAGLASLPGAPAGEDLAALSRILSAAFDRAALHVAGGASPDPYLNAFTWLFSRLR